MSQLNAPENESMSIDNSLLYCLIMFQECKQDYAIMGYVVCAFKCVHFFDQIIHPSSFVPMHGWCYQKAVANAREGKFLLRPMYSIPSVV